MSDLSSAAAVMSRLEEIERDLELRQPLLEQAALNWYRLKRDKEHDRAVEFVSAEGSVELRKAVAEQKTALVGKEAEAEWEAIRAVVRTLETRATIGMALLKAGRL